MKTKTTLIYAIVYWGLLVLSGVNVFILFFTYHTFWGFSIFSAYCLSGISMSMLASKKITNARIGGGITVEDILDDTRVKVLDNPYKEDRKDSTSQTRIVRIYSDEYDGIAKILSDAVDVAGNSLTIGKTYVMKTGKLYDVDGNYSVNELHNK